MFSLSLGDFLFELLAVFHFFLSSKPGQKFGKKSKTVVVSKGEGEILYIFSKKNNNNNRCFQHKHKNTLFRLKTTILFDKHVLKQKQLFFYV